MNPVVPSAGASQLYDPVSPADQVGAESAEQRRKRLLAQQSQSQLPGGITSLAANYGAALSMT